MSSLSGSAATPGPYARRPFLKYEHVAQQHLAMTTQREVLRRNRSIVEQSHNEGPREAHGDENFAGYVEFWLLGDLVHANARVKLFLPSEDFTPSEPRSLAEYVAVCEHTTAFVTARNERIRRLGL